MCLHCVVQGKNHSINISSGSCCFLWSRYSSVLWGLLQILNKSLQSDKAAHDITGLWKGLSYMKFYQTGNEVPGTAFSDHLHCIPLRHIMNQVGMFFCAGHNLHGCCRWGFVTQQTCILHEGSHICSPPSQKQLHFSDRSSSFLFTLQQR